MNMKYKKLTILIVFLISSFPAKSDLTVADTLLYVTSPSRLLITESPSGMEVTVTDSVSEEKVSSVFTEYKPYSSVQTNRRLGFGKSWEQGDSRGLINVCSKSSRWSIGMQGICIGLTNALDQSPVGGIQWSKSIEISWLSCINVSYSFRRSAVLLGLGFDWRNYRVTNTDRCLVANKLKGIDWGRYPDGVVPKYSRLKVFSLQVPLLYYWNIPKTSLHIKAGPIINFNTYASLLTAYDDMNGNRVEDFTTAISPRRFTVDFFANLSFCSAVGVYVRYSPMKVMDASPTLNFSPLTIGFTFGI